MQYSILYMSNDLTFIRNIIPTLVYFAFRTDDIRVLGVHHTTLYFSIRKESI